MLIHRIESPRHTILDNQSFNKVENKRNKYGTGILAVQCVLLSQLYGAPGWGGVTSGGCGQTAGPTAAAQGGGAEGEAASGCGQIIILLLLWRVAQGEILAGGVGRRGGQRGGGGSSATRRQQVRPVTLVLGQLGCAVTHL